MFHRNYAMNLLLENASGYSEKNEIYMLSEVEQAVVNDKMVGNIYQSAIKKRDIDFDSIPNTKGDIQKFQGYDNIIGTLSVVRELSKKFGIKIDELSIVEDAVSNLRSHRPVFERGFGLDVDFLKLYYNTLVYACVESTSLILSSYVNYVKTVNNYDFQMKKGKGIYGNICLESLRSFNNSVKNGEFSKFANNLINKDRQNFMGGTAAAVAIGLAVSIVPVARELVYYFYDSRMRVADYLDQQGSFLEVNSNRVQTSGLNPADKKEVLRKQEAAVNRIEKMADKIRVNSQLTDKSATTKLKQDNKSWTMKTVSGNDDGFLFI